MLLHNIILLCVTYVYVKLMLLEYSGSISVSNIRICNGNNKMVSEGVHGHLNYPDTLILFFMQ